MSKQFLRAVFAASQADHTQQFVNYARRLVSSIGYFVFLTTMLAPPVGFLAVGYYYETSTLELTAANLANAMANDIEISNQVRPPVVDLAMKYDDLPDILYQPQ